MAENSQFPNLYVVGVGKAGTSSIFSWLSAHESVYAPEVKEPNYFGEDLIFTVPRLTESKYLSLYHTDKTYSYKVDASILYMMSKTAAKEIWEKTPDSKIIIMLRDPVQVMYSRWSQNVYVGVEPIGNFSAAVFAQRRRIQGEDIPVNCRVVNDLFYSEWILYSEQIERFFSFFPRENIFIGFFEDLCDEPKVLYESLMDFLMLKKMPYPNFSPINKGRRVKSVYLQTLLRGKNSWLKELSKKLLPQASLKKMRKIIEVHNVDHGSWPELNIELENKLRSSLAPDIMRVERLLDVDLEHWRCRDAKRCII